MKITLYCLIISILLRFAFDVTAGNVRTIAESGTNPLPTADYVVIIERNEATIYKVDFFEEVTWGRLRKMTADKNELRGLVLQFMLDAAAFYHMDDKMFVIIEDEYSLSKSGLDYKAYIKMLSPEQVEKVL